MIKNVFCQVPLVFFKMFLCHAESAMPTWDRRWTHLSFITGISYTNIVDRHSECDFFSVIAYHTCTGIAWWGIGLGPLSILWVPARKLPWGAVVCCLFKVCWSCTVTDVRTCWLDSPMSSNCCKRRAESRTCVKMHFCPSSLSSAFNQRSKTTEYWLFD